MKKVAHFSYVGYPAADVMVMPGAFAMTSVAAMLKTAGMPGCLRVPASQAPRRRRKLWALAARMFCPLVGTCLAVAEMRRLAEQHGLEPAALSDYELHVQVVAACSSRTPLTEAIQRHLERRHAAAVSRSLKVRGEAAILEQWRMACARGEDIPGTLWASLTHADLGEEGWRQIEGDVHMLSHQVGASVRADLHQLAKLRQERQQLEEGNAVLRHELLQVQRQMASGMASLHKRLLDAETRASLVSYREAELTEARRQAGGAAALSEQVRTLTQQVARLESRNQSYSERVARLERSVVTKAQELQAAEAALESLLGVCDADSAPPHAGCHRSCPMEGEGQLAGRCVLCIGGRTNMIDGYRRLVETHGGRFLHHDGGLEESLHRIDTAVATADAVVCQTGCISHAAYWRLKDACKKLGKPCVFLKSPGVTSFARGLVNLANHPELPPPH